MPRQNFIYSLETLYKMTSDLRKKGKRITLTHGAFDLFHIGHLDLLKRSAAISDFLIVGIESDLNISSYKKDKRPVINEYDRCEVINALNCVDAVFINHFETKKENYVYLYRNLLLDYVTIGPNFEFPDMIDWQANQASVQVLTLGTRRLEGTSNIINKIKIMD